MSARPVMMTGVIYPMDKMHAPMPVSFVGNAWDPSLSVGGGPVPPSPPVDPGYSPPWAQVPPGSPTFPIWGPPGIELPPSPGYPPVAGHPLPPIPETPPELPPGTPPNTVVKAPAEGGWGYITDADGALQAVYNPGPGAAGPKR